MNSSVYKVGLYCRLSLDDGSSNESGSITTQKMMLEKYCKDNNLNIYDYYIDDLYGDGKKKKKNLDFKLMYLVLLVLTCH